MARLDDDIFIKIAYDSEDKSFTVSKHVNEGSDWCDTDTDIEEIVSTVSYQLEKILKDEC